MKPTFRVTVFSLCYNEAFILPYFIDHYRNNLPGCRIVIYDNESTDNSVEIALQHGCEVIPYHTGNKLSDRKYLDIKNNCWKGTSGWVFVCDTDEFCDVTEFDLKNESNAGHNVLRFNGYNMVNMEDDLDFYGIQHGVRATSYDKNYCFNASHIRETNYWMGAHSSNMLGKGRRVSLSTKRYRCRHYKYINPDYMVARHAHYASRLSEENLEKGYGGHYLYTEQQIRDEFEQAKKQAIKIQ